MDYFSNSKPELVVPSIQKTINKIVKSGGNKQTISEKISNNTLYFYNTYISKYKFYILVIICVCVFLIYRYYITKNNKIKMYNKYKKERKERKKRKENIEKIEKNIENKEELIIQKQPHNISEDVTSQISYESENIHNGDEEFQQIYPYDDELYSFN